MPSAAAVQRSSASYVISFDLLRCDHSVCVCVCVAGGILGAIHALSVGTQWASQLCLWALDVQNACLLRARSIKPVVFQVQGLRHAHHRLFAFVFMPGRSLFRHRLP